MTRRVLMQRNGETFDLVESPAPNEHHLQEIMKSQPQLIPSDDLGIDGDLLVVGRETALASGYIDLLCISRAGDIVLIEFKTGPQNPDFRHALAQLIDYGSDLWRLTVEDFDRGVVQRYLSGPHAVATYRRASTLADAIATTGWNLSQDEVAGLISRLGEVLTTGDFHYVVAAQRFTPAMQTSLEYMNATMRFGRFYLVEIVQLQGADLVAHAAQVVASPPKRTSAAAGRTAAGQADEAALLSSIVLPDAREAMRDLMSTCSTLGLEVKWREKGASIRTTTSDRKQPLSIGWLLPEGSQWSGAKFVSFGVDPASLEQTPSVEGPVLRFAERLSRIQGARKVAGKLNAHYFEPESFPAAMPAVVAELETLVAEINTVQS
ncbi:endonuclease NucS [Herbiconiux sp. CPCC 203406]|uniref:endonuclease NucS domain-containing protein n=1 Tax=Herbiconiux oxytropis TaxID=2970915 RepID=UPI00217CC7DB|nr:endonuclease NucS domain-containing protein [Herbiconiux oxytropis]MCS5723481.1 endonuclease NucS [Herbiconiux oxytropis]